MPEIYGFTPTNAGRALIAGLLAGETLTITKTMVGSGKPASLDAMAALTDLVEPVAQATSTTPVHSANAVTLTVEYRSDLNGGLKEGFYINEYGIFAKTATSAETLIFYGCLGDHPQYVYAYVEGQAPDVRRYPAVIEVANGVTVQVDYTAAAFITAADAEEMLAAMVQGLSGADLHTITIPAAAWTLDESQTPPGGALYPYYADVTVAGALTTHFPVAAIHPDGLDGAATAGVAPVMRSLAGKARFWARQPAVSNLSASLALISGSEDAPGDGWGVVNAGGSVKENVPGGVVTLDENGKIPASLINLSGDVTGILPEANGGTGAASLDADGVGYDPDGLPITANNVQDALNFLASSYFPTLAVTVPAGSLVTVSKDSYSYQQTAASGSASFILPALGQWTVKAELGGQEATRTVDVDNLGQTYELTVSYFSATLNVTAPAGATVTATCGQTSVNGTVTSGTTVALTIPVAGTYSVVAAFDGANSQAASVAVEEDGETYSAAPAFCTLTVTVDSGSQVQAQNGSTTLTKTSNGTALFYLPNTGTWTVTASLSGQQASDSVECAAYQGYNLTLSYISATLGENDWETIREVSEAGQAPNWWDVGDGKDVVLNGTVMICSFNNLTVTAFIIGFNHNASREGDNLTHFCLGKIDGKQVAFCDSQYNNTGSSSAFRMNTSDTNSGGWQASYMRNTVLGAGTDPKTPQSGSFMAVLPPDLRNVMRSAQKYTYNSNGVTATTDYLTILGEFEVQGQITYANSQEQSYQVQYAYYQAGNSKVRYNHTSLGAAVWWFLRSLYYMSSYGFCAVAADGSAYFCNAHYSGGLAPGFFV